MKKVGADGQTIDLEPKQRVEKFVCEETGKEFEAEQHWLFDSWFPRHRFCPEVQQQKIEAEKKQELERKRQANLATFFQSCPIDFQKFDPKRLNQKSIDEIINQRRKNLCVHGVTGAGKTRTLWEMVRHRLNEMTLGGGSWLFLSARKLADELGDAVFTKQHEIVLQKFCRVQLLVIDDIGKESMSKRWASDFFEILESRTSNKKQTIFSTNYTARQFKDKFATIDGELATALCRRVKDFFESVHFEKSIDTITKPQQKEKNV